MSKHELTHARHAPALCSAPGLFRSLKRGERKSLKLLVVYHCADKRIEFDCSQPLGGDDLRILQGLVSMAGPGGKVLSPKPQTEEGEQLRLDLYPDGDTEYQDAIVVRGSYRGLAREIGYENPDNTRPVRQCIERLWKVNIIVEEDGRRHGFKLLSRYVSDEREGKLYVALNPLIAQAVLGGQHVRICMEEVRAIKSDPTRLIHQRLCCWINPGSSGRVKQDTLCQYLWPDPATNSNTVKSRRKVVRKALAELANIGWTVSQYATQKWEIKRPATRNKSADTPTPTRATPTRATPTRATPTRATPTRPTLTPSHSNSTPL